MWKSRNINIKEGSATAVFLTLSDSSCMDVFVTLLQGCWNSAERSSEQLDLGDAIEDVADAVNMTPNLVERHMTSLWSAQLVSIEEASDRQMRIGVNPSVLAEASRIVSSSSGKGNNTQAIVHGG